MNKLITWLSIALAVQLMIAGGLLAAQRQSSTENIAQPLLALEQGGIDRVVINADETSVTMAKAEDRWRLDGQENLPVDESKLEGVIDQIETARLSWPVAQTNSSRERLEVADDKYQKRLQLYSGDELVSDLYVGTSPGFRKVHVRRAGEDDVYAVELNSYDLTVKTNDWLDKQALKMDEITQIKGTDFNLKNVDDNWAFVNDETQGDASQETLELDKDKAKELASAISGLRVQGVADQAPDETPVEITVSGSDGEVKYQFAEKDDKYYVTRNDIDAVFTLSKYDYERITKFNRNQLAKQQATPEEEAEENS